ncbi:MAG: hypothetical protein LBT62_02930, partial [Deltaproteobacteria bacterium]|nr:hypothetical protein [Deltaproteobacteria bacterium]
MGAIDSHEAELKEELKAAQWLEKPYDMEMALAGPAVIEHAISMNILSELLDQVQNLRFATAEMACGTYRDGGTFSDKLLKMNQLVVECVTPSSFAIQLKYTHNGRNSSFFNSDADRPGENLFLTLLSDESDFEDFKTSTMSTCLHSYYQDFLSF